MSDAPITPIRPIRPVHETREIELRRRPSMGQLKQWLAFARKKGKQRKAALQQQEQDKDAPPRE